MKFTLRQLEYFVALTRHEAFGRAAEACNVSQPALSVQIKALEDLLGGPLVERRARAITLTPLGRQMLPLMQRTLAAAQMLEEAATLKDGGHGALAIGLIPTVAPYLLPDALAGLRARDISLQIDVREARTEPLLDALEAGQLDAAVIALPGGREGLVETPLFDDRFLLAASPDWPKGTTIARPTDLGSSPLMLLEDGHCLSDQALEACRRDKRQAGIHTGASSLGTLLRLVEAGFGLTFLPEIALNAERQSAPDLKLQRFEAPEPFRTIGLVRRAATADGPWFSSLAAILEETGRSLVAKARAQIT